MNAFADPFKKTLEKLLPAGSSQSGIKPLLKPVDFKTKAGKTQQLWIDQDGKLWVGSSELVSLDTWLKGTGSKGQQETQDERSEVQENYGELIGLLNNASGGGSSSSQGGSKPPKKKKPRARSSASSSSGNGQSNTLGKVPPAKNDLEKSLQELADELGKLGACAVSKGSCMVEGTPAHIDIEETLPMSPRWIAGYYRVLGRVESMPEDMILEEGPPADHLERRLLYLIANPGQDDEVFITLLRHVDWVHEHNAKVGSVIQLDLREMGIVGQASVLRIDACPTEVRGKGSLVTGTFAHRSGQVLWVHTNAETKPIGTTPTHPFWSVDRQDWVAAAKLKEGETLLTLFGATTVRLLSIGDESVPVYNIEVEGDHVYRVGQSGVLVHNQSVERLTTAHRNPGQVSGLSPNEMVLRDEILGPGSHEQTHLWVYRVEDGDHLGDFVLIHMGYGTKARAIALELKNPNNYSSTYNFEFDDFTAPQIQQAELNLLLAGICDVNGIPLPNLSRVGGTDLTASSMFVGVLWVDIHNHQNGLFDELNQRFGNL